MQWLADTGVRFEHAFTPNPVCSPARASFWTGEIPSRHGVHDWLGEPNEDPEHHGIGGRETLASQLKGAGYRTGLVGKWHAGDYWKPMPGFDTWFTSLKGTNARFGEQQFIDGTERKRYFGHQETILTDRAIQFLREDTEKAEPFFLFVGYTNTHTPHAGESAPLVHHYKKKSFSDIPRETYSDVHGKIRIAGFDPDEPDRRRGLAEYYAAVEGIDQQMLRIVSELENRGELDNTVIVYTGDHGHMNGHHGLHTKANATIPSNFLEETIHIPLLMRWPEQVPEGISIEAPVDHCDLHASLLDIGGVKANEAFCPGGRVFGLWNDEAEWRDWQCVESGPNRMIRRGSLKLICRWPHPSGIEVRDELYDLNSDPRERVNVIENPAYADAVQQMKAEMTAFYERYEDPARSGINPEALAVRHNPGDAWTLGPETEMHRQG